ncbi:MAG: PqqD family peptide modification chaperone [Campylobacterota bacterium]|nr:PqqD family peptide modification chaperone [Campylobacterota bacterium]
MKKWYISQNLVLREESDDWGVLFDPDTGNSVALNPVAISIFKVMRQTQNMNSIISAIHEEYEEIPETLSQDIVDLIDTLAQDGFIGFEK